MTGAKAIATRVTRSLSITRAADCRLQPSSRACRARKTSSLLLCFALLLIASCEARETPTPPEVAGDPKTGAAVIADIGCGVCHVIPGIPGARGTVGPPLAGFAGRAYIAGTIPNRPELLVQWVRDAPSLAPDTAMPDLPLTDRQALDVAAYLYTLR